MFSLSSRRFHSLLIAPALLPFLFLIGPSAPEDNHPPTAVDDNYTVHGILFASGNSMLENDTDPDGDSFSVTSFTQATHGTFTYSYSYGAATYQPNYGFTGTDSISYQICDSLGLCDSATVTFNVVNNPPIASPDEYRTSVNRTLFVGGPDALVANDSDPDHDFFNLTAYTEAHNGHVVYSFSAGGFAYTPNENFIGRDSFTYTICDYLGLCAPGTATIRVIGDGENGGATSCNMNIGGPINVTNGNMYTPARQSALVFEVASNENNSVRFDDIYRCRLRLPYQPVNHPPKE